MNDTHELDRNRKLCAAAEVDALLHRMRRTDAAPDADELQSWHDTTPFLVSMMIIFWLVVAIKTWRFFA